jgi:hypothetical protein
MSIEKNEPDGMCKQDVKHDGRKTNRRAEQSKSTPAHHDALTTTLMYSRHSSDLNADELNSTNCQLLVHHLQLYVLVEGLAQHTSSSSASNCSSGVYNGWYGSYVRRLRTLLLRAISREKYLLRRLRLRAKSRKSDSSRLQDMPAEQHAA